MRGATGFLFVPRFSFSGEPSLDRVLVPAGADNAERRQLLAACSANNTGPAPEDIYQKVGQGESAYDTTLQDLARTRHAALAETIACSVFYPAYASLLADSTWPVREILAAAALMLLGAGMVFAVTHVKVPGRTRLRAQPLPA